MGFTKKLNRFGGESFGIVLTKDLLALLEISPEQATSAEGARVAIKVYGDTLIVRRADAPPITPADTAYYLTEDIEFARFFPASPVALGDDLPVTDAPSQSLTFKAGKEVRTTRLMKRALNAFKAYGALSRAELAERLGIQAKSATALLSRGFEDDLLIKQGQQYALNPERFEP